MQYEISIGTEWFDMSFFEILVVRIIEIIDPSNSISLFKKGLSEI